MGAVTPAYYIADGVRRSVAARLTGLLDIVARIVEPGKPDVVARVPLDQLYSPKAAINCDGRYLRLEMLTRAGSPLPPIEVQPLGLPGQGKGVPLAQVQLQ